MNVAIVYDSRTGRTKRCAGAMMEALKSAGHEVTLSSVEEANPKDVTGADAICIGSWTQGLFFFFQHPTKASLHFIERLGVMHGKPAAVFCTYRTSPGSLLEQLAAPLRGRGANVMGKFMSKGPVLPRGFEGWVKTLSAIEVNEKVGGASSLGSRG